MKIDDGMKLVKEQYSKHDVVVSNILNHVMIDLLHPDFVKEFYLSENIYTYPKVKMLVNPIIRGIGSGIIIDEGELWKKKRKILNKVFNFQFIKDMTKKMAEICDESIS